MRIHRVRLRNFRAVDECEVEFDPNGVTIVEGDNEVGKSSLAEAIDLILDSPDSSKAKQVEDVFPVHRDEGPEVEIEMSAGPYRLVYAKRWKRKPMTRLQLVEPKREQLTGREAHDRVVALLEEVVDVGLLRALRVDQGEELAPATFKAARSLERALDAAVGGDTASAGDQEDNLWTRIELEYGRFWTAGGKPRKERKELAERLAAVAQSVTEIESRLGALAEDSETVDRLGRELARLHTDLEGQRSAATTLDAEWQEAGKLQREGDRLETVLRSCASSHEALVQAARSRELLISQTADRREELAQHLARKAAASPTLKAAQDGVEATETALQDAEQRRGVLEGARAEAAAERDLHHYRETLMASRGRHDRVVAAQEEAEKAEAVREENAVDDAALRAIEDADVALKTAEAVAARGTWVSATALEACALEIDGEPISIAAGASEERIVEEELELVVPGIVRISVRSGSQARSLADDLRSARDEFTKLCGAAGVADATEARSAARARHEAESRRRRAMDTISFELAGHTPQSLAAHVTKLEAQIAEAESVRTSERPPPLDLPAAEAALLQAEQVMGDAVSQAERCRSARAQAAERLSLLRLEEAGVAARIQSAGDALQRSEQALDASREDRADALIESELAEAGESLARARERCKEAAASLKAVDPATLEARIVNARAVVERTRADIERRDERRRGLVIKLELEGERGMAHELDAARTEHAHLALECERLEARAAAAGLLHLTFEQRRNEARQRYVAPFQERIEKLGRIVFGPDFQVELDEELRVARRTLGGIALDYAQLSVGAREQLGIICRLACAQLVSSEGGAPVIFDDALGWTDPGRLERMGAVLASAQGDCQVIVLTCTPGRYSSVGSARVVTLE